MKAQKGNKVKVEYTGKFDDGTIFDSSQGREPLAFKVGAKQVIPGFDNVIKGMKLNEKKTIKILADEAYGQPNEELKKEVPRSALPQDQEPKEGMQLLMQTPDGHQIPARIAKVNKDKVILDLNHPLAGKNLTFEIKLVEIKEDDGSDGDEHECCGGHGDECCKEDSEDSECCEEKEACKSEDGKTCEKGDDCCHNHKSK